MKVCMFVYNDFLNDTRVLKEARSLIACGYEVAVIALSSRATKPFEERDGIKVIRIKTPIHYRVFYSALDMLTGIKRGLIGLVSKGKDTIHSGNTDTSSNINEGERGVLSRKSYAMKINPSVANPFKKRMMWLLITIHKLLSFVDFYFRSYSVAVKYSADIYHANDLNTLPVAWLVARRCSAKLVYDSHELYVEKNKLTPSNFIGKFLLSKVEAFLIRRTDAVMTVNESIADELSQRYHIKKPAVIMNAPSRSNGVIKSDVNLLRDALGIKPDYYMLLYLGFLTFNRGIEKMIQSLEYLPKCHLVLMGYGTDWYKKQLRDLILKNGVESRVSFFGPVPPDEVIKYAAGADLGVAPIENACLSYYYCSPNKVFEYINAGLAVVASDFPELKGVINKHEIGCTFNPDEPRDIARAVEYIFEDPERWRRMKQNTIAASNCYNWENESEKFLSLYKTIS